MKKSVSKKLEVSRRKVSRLWRHYRVEKKKILSRKRLDNDFKWGLVLEQRDVTKANISMAWEGYREWKFEAIHSSPYKDFIFVKRTQTINTKQEWYKARKSFFDDYANIEQKLDYQIVDILNKPGVKGVMLLFKVKDEDNDLVHYVSDYITSIFFTRLNNQNISMFENLSDKLKFSNSVHEYEMKGIYIRIIYEKSKKIQSK